MKRVDSLFPRLCVAVAMFCCPIYGNGLAAQPATSATERVREMDRDILAHVIGSWKLVSFNIRDQLGNTTFPFSKDAQGRITYEANGRMAVQVLNPNRPKLSTQDPLAAPEAEIRTAFGEFTAYYGTFSVNAAKKTITHHIEAALLPNWSGTTQERHFEFDGTRLSLSGPLLIGGVQGTVNLVWERLP